MSIEDDYNYEHEKRRKLQKALKELPLKEIEERLRTYSKNSHLDSPSERAYVKLQNWIEKHGALIATASTAASEKK